MQQRLPHGLPATDGGSVEASAEDRVSGGIQRRTVEQIVGLLVTTLRKLLVKLGLLGVAQHSATAESEVEGSSGEAGSSWPGADGTTSAGVATVAETVGKSRPPGIANHGSTAVVSFGEAGPSWSTANGNSAAATAAVKSVGEARPSRIVKFCVTSESESQLAESSDEESSPRERGPQWTAQQWAERRREFEAVCHRWRKERGLVVGVMLPRGLSPRHECVLSPWTGCGNKEEECSERNEGEGT